MKYNIIDKKLYPELQQQYCPNLSPYYNNIAMKARWQEKMICCGTWPVIFKIERIDEE